MALRTIRGGKGIGDAIYVQAVARHITQTGERLSVATSWPDVFLPLGDMVEFVPFRRDRIDVLAHYSSRKAAPTRQWQDVCINAKTPGAELRLDWRYTSYITDRIDHMARGRKVIAVQLPRTPMDRKDAFGAELLPDCRAIQKLIDGAKDRGAFIVQIGAGRPLFQFAGIDLDLANKTTVRELFDVALVADGFLGYVSFVVPMAESLDKPALLVWSRRGLKAAHAYVRQITPEKILEKPTSRAVFDDATDDQLQGALSELL